MDETLHTPNTLVADRAALLPVEITDIITDGTLDVLCFELQETYTLTEKQIALLKNEIALTVLLFLSPDDFIDRIHESLEISPKKANQIGLEVQKKVFSQLNLVFELVFENSGNHTNTREEQLKHLQQNFQSLREEALQTNTQQATQEGTPPAAVPPDNLPTGTPNASETATIETAPETPSTPTTQTSEEVPTIQVPKAVTKTSYTVEPMRTMGGDVTRIHGYGAYRDLFPEEAGEQAYKEEVIKGASQEDILQEKPQLTEKPTYGDA